MRVVVDTSVLFEAAIRHGSVRKVFLGPGPVWIAPRAVREEIRGHADRIGRELHIPRAEAIEFVESLLSRLTEIPLSEGDPEYIAAVALIGGRDRTDAPFVAAALKSSAVGIWSLDKDFEDLAGVPRLSTAEVGRLARRVARGEEE